MLVGQVAEDPGRFEAQTPGLQGMGTIPLAQRPGRMIEVSMTQPSLTQ